MPISASKLRSDIYRILDEVVRTGVPVQIEREGHILGDCGQKRAEEA